MNRYRKTFLASAFCLCSIATATACDPPQPAPEASEQALLQLERDGAYRCKLMIVDANGERVAAMNGVAANSATLQASPVAGRSGFETSINAGRQADGNVEVTLELGERTDVTVSDSGATTWKSTKFHLVKKVKLGSEYETSVAGWETTRPGPLKLTLSIEQFKADVR